MQLSIFLAKNNNIFKIHGQFCELYELLVINNSKIWQ